MPDDPDGWRPADSSSLSKRFVQNEREAHAGLAQLHGHVVGGGRHVFVGQA
jgi:hypothetical protein